MSSQEKSTPSPKGMVSFLTLDYISTRSLSRLISHGTSVALAEQFS